MSIALQKQVWKLDLAPMEKLVLLKLAYHVSDKDKTGEAYPSVANMASETGLSERQVQRYLAGLVDSGIIVVVDNEKGGRGKARTYRFTILKGDTHDAKQEPKRVTPRAVKGDTEGATDGAQRVSPTTERVTPTAIKGDTHDATYIRTEPEEKQEETAIAPTVPEKRSASGANRRQPERPFPDDLALDDKRRTYAIEKGMDDTRAEVQFERFRNHAETHDRKCRNWDAAWRNWVLGDIAKYGKSATPTPGEDFAWQVIKGGQSTGFDPHRSLTPEAKAEYDRLYEQGKAEAEAIARERERQARAS